MLTQPIQTGWAARFRKTRQRTTAICRNLQTEDYVVQPVADVSPPKWHLGHSTWFFETFLLIPFAENYRLFHPDFSYVFNSYYETVGKRVLRTDRGNLTRPTVAEVYEYRNYVDEQLSQLLDDLYNQDFPRRAEFETLLTLGLNHEEQHQELLVTDLKYILGHNPLFPSVAVLPEETFVYNADAIALQSVAVAEGVYEM